MSLSDIYVSHDIKGIFILVSAITSLGGKFIMRDEFCNISRNGDTIASACLKDRLYWLEMNPVDHSSTERIDEDSFIQVDRSGPHTPMRSGATSYQVISDRWTVYCETMISRTKATGTVDIIEFVNRIQNITVQKVKAIRMDGAADYSNAKYIQFLVEFGIEKQTSAPYRQIKMDSLKEVFK